MHEHLTGPINAIPGQSLADCVDGDKLREAASARKDDPNACIKAGRAKFS